MFGEGDRGPNIFVGTCWQILKFESWMLHHISVNTPQQCVHLHHSLSLCNCCSMFALTRLPDRFTGRLSEWVPHIRFNLCMSQLYRERVWLNNTVRASIPKLCCTVQDTYSSSIYTFIKYRSEGRLAVGPGGGGGRDGGHMVGYSGACGAAAIRLFSISAPVQPNSRQWSEGAGSHELPCRGWQRRRHLQH